MRKFIALLLLLLMAATPAWLWAQGWPSYTMPLVAKDGVFVSADHSGAIFVTQRPAAYGGAAWLVQIEHAQSVLHIAGLIRGFGPQGTNVVDLSNAALQVNCVVGCGSGGTQAHITSVTHIIGSAQLINQAGVVATFTGASLNVNCTGGCAGGSSDAVNVFHQSTVRHVSSVTHVAGALSLVNRAGSYATLTGTSLDVNLTNTPTIQVGNTPNTTPILVNVGHISGQLHVASIVDAAQHVSGGFTFGAVADCGTTARTVIATNANRRSLIVQNAGGFLVYIGGTHATITAANGFPLHASSASQNPQNWHATLARIELPFYRGPIACLSVGGQSGLRYVEILDPGGAPRSGF